MSKLLRNGSKGDDVRALQKQLTQLGYDVDVDGDFGPGTEKAVLAVQGAFGYTVDGLVGKGTKALLEAQIGYGWNAKSADAQDKANAAQGKGPASVDKGAPAKGK